MAGASALRGDTEGWGFCSLEKRLLQPSHAYKALSIRMEPLSSQQMYVETRGIQKLFLCKDIQAVVRVCPELCSLRPRRFSRTSVDKALSNLV